MEWKKNPSEDSLEKSGKDDGYGRDSSREAGNFSEGENNRHGQRIGRASSRDDREVQPRRRRRISEMGNDQRRQYNSDSQRVYDKTQDSDEGFGWQNQDYNSDRSQERAYYKEQYNQVRETNRQRYDNDRSESSSFPDRRSKSGNYDHEGYRPSRGNGGYAPERNRGANRDRSGYQSSYNRKNNLGGRGEYSGEEGGYSNKESSGYQSGKSGSRQDNNRQHNVSNSPNRDRNGHRGSGNRYTNNNRQGAPKHLQSKTRTAPIYEDMPIDPNEKVRLNKFLSNSGVCSRREADELIKAGAVIVNGVPVTEMGIKISAQDRVEVNGKEIKPENKVYILLNKPRNCVTTTDDPQERLTVMNLVRKACNERIYPVGRLDRNTTGVLLLTNDGELASKLVHPSFKKKKIYHVWLDKEVSVEDMQAIANGVELEDGEMHADAISYTSEEDHTQVGIEIHSGRNRIVRRIFEHLGYHVVKLDRVYFAGLTKKNLGRGKWRYLTQEEVSNLKMGAFE